MTTRPPCRSQPDTRSHRHEGRNPLTLCYLTQLPVGQTGGDLLQAHPRTSICRCETRAATPGPATSHCRLSVTPNAGKEMVAPSVITSVSLASPPSDRLRPCCCRRR